MCIHNKDILSDAKEDGSGAKENIELEYGKGVFTLGIPGSGKTYVQKLLIHRLREKDPNVNVFIITPVSASDYADLIRKHNGIIYTSPHLVNDYKPSVTVMEHCKERIPKQASGIFMQMDIGTESANLYEMFRNAWACFSAIREKMRENPDEKYAIAMDDTDMFLNETCQLPDFGYILLQILEETASSKNCALLLAGNWEKSVYTSYQFLNLVEEKNMDVLFRPITEEDVKAAKRCFHLRKNDLGLLCHDFRASANNSGLAVLLIEHRKGILPGLRKTDVDLNVAPEEHKICANSEYYRECYEDIMAAHRKDA